MLSYQVDSSAAEIVSTSSFAPAGEFSGEIYTSMRRGFICVQYGIGTEAHSSSW